MTDERFYMIAGTVSRLIGVTFLVAIGVILTDIRKDLNGPSREQYTVCLATQGKAGPGILCKRMTDLETVEFARRNDG